MCGFLETSSAAFSVASLKPNGGSFSSLPSEPSASSVPSRAGNAALTSPTTLAAPPATHTSLPSIAQAPPVASLPVADATVQVQQVQPMLPTPAPPAPAPRTGTVARDDETAVKLWTQLGGPLERAVRKNRQLEDENKKLQENALALRRQLAELQQAEAARQRRFLAPPLLVGVDAPTCGVRPTGDALFAPWPRGSNSPAQENASQPWAVPPTIHRTSSDGCLAAATTGEADEEERWPPSPSQQDISKPDCSKEVGCYGTPATYSSWRRWHHQRQISSGSGEDTTS